MFMLIDQRALFPILAEATRQMILDIPESEWFRYDNPFERKTSMGYQKAMSNAYSVTHYVAQSLCGFISAKSGIDVRPDQSGAFTSIFKYEAGDYLQPHLDAGLHPNSDSRKRITALLYLSTWDSKGGNLIFYTGTDKPGEISFVVEPKINTLVVFENTDYAWHGCQIVTRGTRIVVTASYLSDPDHNFKNQRRKAYFAPAPGVEWSEELYKLRDDRADINKASQVYVTGS